MRIFTCRSTFLYGRNSKFVLDSDSLELINHIRAGYTGNLDLRAPEEEESWYHQEAGTFRKAYQNPGFAGSLLSFWFLTT